MFIRSYLLAVGAWEICVIGTFLAVVVLRGGHIWGKDDLIWIAELTLGGTVVVAVVAQLSRRFRTLGGGFVGFLCGLVPSTLLLAYAVLAQPGFEASAGSAGFAYMLALPSAVGGAFAGIVFSRHIEKIE